MNILDFYIHVKKWEIINLAKNKLVALIYYKFQYICLALYDKFPHGDSVG